MCSELVGVQYVTVDDWEGADTATGRLRPGRAVEIGAPVVGLGIAPHSEVRGVMVETGHGLVPLVDGVPVVLGDRRSRVNLRPLHITSGRLVLEVYRSADEILAGHRPPARSVRRWFRAASWAVGAPIVLHGPRDGASVARVHVLVLGPTALDLAGYGVVVDPATGGYDPLGMVSLGTPVTVPTGAKGHSWSFSGDGLLLVNTSATVSDVRIHAELLP